MSFSMVERLAALIVHKNPAELEGVIVALGTPGAGLSDDAIHLAFALIQERRRVPVTAKRRYGGPGLRVQKPPKRPEAIARRRRCAASGAVPSKIACHLTLGETAVLAVIAGEVRKHGCCLLPIDAIAARSGTSRSVVNRALRAAKVCGFIKPVSEFWMRCKVSAMRLTTLTDFGLRALILLADRSPQIMSAAAIADHFRLSSHHMAKVLQALAAAGYVEGIRGAQGG